MINALIVHGAIVILFGNLCGFPLGAAQKRGLTPDQVHAWKVAHSGLCMGGTMMIAVAWGASQLGTRGWLADVFYWSSLASGYGFALALPLIASKTGETSSVDLRKSPVIAVGNIAGVFGSMLSILALIASAALR